MKVLLVIFLALCMPLALIFLSGLTLWGLIQLFWKPILIIIAIRVAIAIVDALSAKKRS